MTQGIKVYDTSGKITYDSERPRLQVAIDRSPPHLDKQILNPNVLTANAGNSFEAVEILYQIKHGLGYKPRVLIYFLRPGTNRYDCGRSFIQAGIVQEIIKYSVDEQNFSIIHQLDDFSSLGATSSPIGLVSCKFMIFSNPVNDYTDPTKRGTTI